MSKLKKGDNQETGGCGNFRYGYASDEPFHVWIVFQRNPKLRVPVSYPTKRIYDNGTVEVIDWTCERLHDAMQVMLRLHCEQYKGDWYLEIKEPEPQPSFSELVKMRADRVAAKLAAALPKLEMPPKPPLPNREMLERIGKPLEAAPTTGPQNIDWTDPDLRVLPREPGEDE